MQLKYLIIISLIMTFSSASTECAPYFNPEKFLEAPVSLTDMLDNYENLALKKEFDIIKKELNKLDVNSIASDINSDMEGFWNSWDGDAYQIYLTPEYTLFEYNDFYFSLKVFIDGVKGDATTLKQTTVTYHIFNYTNEVNKFIVCQKENEK